MTENKSDVLHKVEQEKPAMQEKCLDPNINPETGKVYTPNENVAMLLDKFSSENNLTTRDIANALAQSLVNQTKIHEKAAAVAKAEYDANLGTVRAMELHANAIRFQEIINKEKVFQRSPLVEMKELQSREITASKIIDNHKSEMLAYQKEYIDHIVKSLQLTAKTDEEKAIVAKVIEMSGYTLPDVKNSIDAEINGRAEKRFASYVADHGAKLKIHFGEKKYNEFLNRW